MATLGRVIARILIGIVVGPTVGVFAGAFVGLLVSGDGWVRGVLMGGGIGVYLGIITGAILGSIGPLVCHAIRCAAGGTVVGLAAGYALWSSSLEPRWAVACAAVGCAAGAGTTLIGRLAGKIPHRESVAHQR